MKSQIYVVYSILLVMIMLTIIIQKVKAFYIQISEQYKTCVNLNEFITK
jgi:hypothetical protein